MTLAQGVGIAAALFALTVVLGLAVLAAFNREDKRQERRRAMGEHPSSGKSLDEHWESNRDLFEDDDE